MQSKLLSASAFALLSASFAAAQTSSSCNPVEGDTCPADPAFGTTVEIDFTAGASSYFTEAEGTTITYDDTKGAVFTMDSETDAPTITSTKYLFFGTVEVVCQVAPGTGIVTSFVLQSDDLDEIDWEWLGGDTTQAQTNYFSKGETTTYDRGGFSDVSSPQTSFHTYTVDWTTESVVWSIDGTAVRTLTAADATAKGAPLPQTPMQVKLGTWDGGSSTAANGTVEWAGGLTPWGTDDGPYIAYYKSIKIVDKSNGVSGAKSYSYSGTSGTYESIVVSTTDDATNSTSSSASASAATTKTTSSSTAASATTTKTTSSSTSAASAATTTSSGTKVGTTKAKATAVADSSSSGAAESATTTESTAAAATTLSTATGTGSAATDSASNATLSTGSSPTPTASSAASTSSAVTTSGAGKMATGIFGAFAALMAAFVTL